MPCHTTGNRRQAGDRIQSTDWNPWIRFFHVGRKTPSASAVIAICFLKHDNRRVGFGAVVSGVKKADRGSC